MARYVKHTQILKETVVDPGRIPKIIWPSLVHALTPASVLHSLSDCFNPFAEQMAIHTTVLIALTYKRRYASLVGSEPENSIMARVVKLTLQFTEREYIIRLTLLISNLAEFCPKAINLERYPAMEVSEMIQCFVQLEQESKRNRCWLWEQFPSQYRQPVIISKSEMSYKSGIKSVVKCCEDRIGRIIVNVAQSSFDVYEKGGDMFPHWQTVQYILPCYVANLVEKAEETDNPPNLKNSVKFIHGLIRSYENAFQSWSMGVKQEDIKINSMYEVFELRSCSLYYRDLANSYISTYICLQVPVECSLDGVVRILDTLTEWGKEENNSEMLPFLKSWYIKTYHYMKNLYDVCLEVFQPPLPGSPISVPQLSEFYMEDAVLQALEYAVIASTRDKTSLQARLVRDMEKDPLNNIIWKWIFIGYITNMKEHQGNDIEGLSVQHRIEMSSTYEILKMYIKEQGKIKMNFIHLYPSNPAQIQIALKQCMDGNIEELDRMLVLLANPEISITMSSHTQNTSTVKKPTDVKPKRCRNCPQIEKPKGSFIVCRKCINEKYPDVYYFCSKKCEEVCWLNKHKGQHLDFILGLGDFEQLSTK
jgi:hypothetical protein